MDMALRYKQDMARDILGRDYISPDIVHEARGVSYPIEQIEYLMEMLPSRSDLERCCDNNAILIAGTPSPLSLNDIRKLNPELFYNKTGGWWSEPLQKFSHKDKVHPGWLMLCKAPAKRRRYRSNSWMERLGLVSRTEYTPNAPEIAWGITTYKEICGAWLFPDIHVGTSSLDSGGNRVFVGFSAIGGIGVNCSWGICCLDPIGLAAALRQNTKNGGSGLFFNVGLGRKTIDPQTQRYV